MNDTGNVNFEERQQRISKSAKVILDPLYGYINIDALAMSIIDTPEFCRLRDLKQLGLCHYVFPSAVQNRFVHSLQTYHLATVWAQKLQLQNIMPIQIAALVHDIGHVVGSHAFDHLFRGIIPDHEARTQSLFRHIVKKYHLRISSDEVELICAMIRGERIGDYPPYLFQIVANHYNEFDVDKIYVRMDAYMIGFDHNLQENRIMSKSKIIDGEICFDERVYYLIYEVYYRRCKEFRDVLKHHACVSVEGLLFDILRCLDKIYDFQKLFQSPDLTWTCLTDSIIESCHSLNLLHPSQLTAELCSLFTKLATRDWKKLYPYASEAEKDVTTTVALSGADFHPMDKLWFYKEDNPGVKYRINHNPTSVVVSSSYSETVSWKYKTVD